MPEPAALRPHARFQVLLTEASRLIPPDKPLQLARDWMGRPRAAGSDPVWEQARELATDLAMMTPSLLGVTAFDRLARGMAGRAPADRAAADLLRHATLRLLRLSGRHSEDLVTGALVPFVREDGAASGVLFGRFAELTDGQVVPAGRLRMLDEDAAALARTFIRPGRGGLPVRCAEAVYRHLAQRTALAPQRAPFDPDGNRIDHLAARWASLGRDPTEAEFARARVLAGVETAVETLISVAIAEHHGLAPLARAYRFIAAIMVETIALRGANGSARVSLDAVAAALDERIAARTCPPGTRTLFDTLCAGVRRAKPAAGGGTTANADLDKLVQRIQGLRAKTVEQGCTEQEALAAAEKVAELLDRYGLSLSELDLRQQACEGIGVETGRKRRGPIDDCMGTIAAFFDCRVWAETNPDETLRYVFFGMPGDVQASVYLHDLITMAFTSETAAFQAGPIYRRTPSGNRRNATTSFQAGLARGIVLKLNDLGRERDGPAAGGNGGSAAGGTTGRALVPVKESIIDAEMERLGLNLRRRGATRRYVQRDAYGAGQEAGERFEYRPGIGRE